MDSQILGLHHVTAITSDPQRNLDFYTGVLGLRLVKLTVNFDDPGSYHLYYGDELGHPGTILTFFAWPGAPRGRNGVGQVVAVAFAVPVATDAFDTLAHWKQRLTEAGVALEEPEMRFNEPVLAFEDPDGMKLELVTRAGVDQRPGWSGGPVPVEAAIRGIAGVTLAEREHESTAALLTGTMGLRARGASHDRVRYSPADESSATVLDVLRLPEAPRGRIAAGNIHHIAWRTPNDDQQVVWREHLADEDVQITPVLDRTYFHSIYFREPGGALFEIATDPPGFTVDEPADMLGSTLKLPPWLESQRAEIENTLPPIQLPCQSEN